MASNSKDTVYRADGEEIFVDFRNKGNSYKPCCYFFGFFYKQFFYAKVRIHFFIRNIRSICHIVWAIDLFTIRVFSTAELHFSG